MVGGCRRSVVEVAWLYFVHYANELSKQHWIHNELLGLPEGDQVLIRQALPLCSWFLARNCACPYNTNVDAVHASVMRAANLHVHVELDVLGTVVRTEVAKVPWVAVGACLHSKVRLSPWIVYPHVEAMRLVVLGKAGDGCKFKQLWLATSDNLERFRVLPYDALNRGVNLAEVHRLQVVERVRDSEAQLVLLRPDDQEQLLVPQVHS